MRRIFLNLDQVTSNELGSKTLTQLRDIAKEIGIKSVSKYKKNELIELINENIKKQEPVEVKTNIAQENKKDENVENKSYVKSYEKKNTDNRYQRNENKSSNTEYVNTRNNKGYYTPKVVEESKIVDECEVIINCFCSVLLRSLMTSINLLCILGCNPISISSIKMRDFGSASIISKIILARSPA